MHTRRFSMAILGVWVGITVAMVFIAIQNFKAVDQLLEAPSGPASKMMVQLGVSSSRMLLRYQVSELNRFYFDVYGTAQIWLALLLAGTLLFATNGNRLTMVLCALTFLVVIFEKFWLTPEITYLGRLVDFVPEMVVSAERSRFWSFRSAYSSAEAVKGLLLLLIALKMLVKTEPRRHRRSRHTDMDLTTATVAD
ncbi:MAG: DUF4149 domain-containing protein [Bryobacteraceae bacterium]|nr:DUF4149 domain-containing protein [Bryobacteraceae bacterium]